MGGQRIGYACISLSLSLSLCDTLSKARAFVATRRQAGPFFYVWCSLQKIFFPKNVSFFPEEKKRLQKEKKRIQRRREKRERERTASTTTTKARGRSNERKKERKQTGTDGGQPRADDAFREEEEKKEEINDEQHFGRREGEDVECGRCL